jgi:pyridoxal phosphate enzyme (YggS family)
MELANIRANAERILAELPSHVTLVAAGKTRTHEQLNAVIDAGVKIIGHNYIQEAASSIESLGRRAKWHCIGHLQSNKINKATILFDMIETIDDLKTALALDRACASYNKSMPILLEINSADETSKWGIDASQAVDFAHNLAQFEHLEVQGLMTMGAFSDDPEHYRHAFRLTKQLFDHIDSIKIPGVNMHYLSMGMSNSYQVAIEEGANMVRIGSRLFGPR